MVPPTGSEDHANPALSHMNEDVRAFLKRDVGWFFGTVFTLAALQGAFFAYDDILNQGRIMSAVMDAVAHAWRMYKPW